MEISHLTFRSPHHIKGLSELCVTNSSILLSHFLLLWNEFASSFHPLFGTYVFNKRSVSNSTRITRPSGSYFEANYKNKNKNSSAVNKTWIKIPCTYVKNLFQINPLVRMLVVIYGHLKKSCALILTIQIWSYGLCLLFLFVTIRKSTHMICYTHNKSCISFKEHIQITTRL